MSFVNLCQVDDIKLALFVVAVSNYLQHLSGVCLRGQIIYLPLCAIFFHVTCTVTSFSCTIISFRWRVILSLGSDTCTEGLSRNSQLSKTYVQGYLDVPCYREVVLNDEGYEMNLGRVDFETNWEDTDLVLLWMNVGWQSDVDVPHLFCNLSE